MPEESERRHYTSYGIKEVQPRERRFECLNPLEALNHTPREVHNASILQTVLFHSSSRGRYEERAYVGWEADIR